jgi:hypothetical protein
MQSIARAFKDYLGIEIERTQRVNDIVLAQGCRHVIVHSGGIVDDRLVRQLSSAQPRRLKPRLVLGERIQFTDEARQSREQPGPAKSLMLLHLPVLDRSCFLGSPDS